MSVPSKSIHDEIQEMVLGELGISHLSRKEQEEIVTGFGQVVFQAVMISLLEALPTEKQKEFMKFVEKEDDAGAREFLAREVPDYETVISSAIAEELRRFKEFQAGVV